MQTVDEGGGVRIGGRRLSDTESRQWHRWRSGSCPSLWTCDRWAVSVLGVHINAFFQWAREHGRPSWAEAEPWFETEELGHEAMAELDAAWPLPPGETADVVGAGTGAEPDELAQAA
jgi:hypothetical protein